MTDKKDPIVVTIKKKQTEEEAIREKEREKQLELIEKIENEEKTLQQEPDSISKDKSLLQVGQTNISVRYFFNLSSYIFCKLARVSDT